MKRLASHFQMLNRIIVNHCRLHFSVFSKQYQNDNTSEIIKDTPPLLGGFYISALKTKPYRLTLNHSIIAIARPRLRTFISPS